MLDAMASKYRSSASRNDPFADRTVVTAKTKVILPDWFRLQIISTDELDGSSGPYELLRVSYSSVILESLGVMV